MISATWGVVGESGGDDPRVVGLDTLLIVKAGSMVALFISILLCQSVGRDPQRSS
jgi:hypothetical protein